MGKGKQLDDLFIYQASMEIAEQVWREIEKWDYFNRSTIGKQLMRSIDSVAANIREGYGRYHYKESKHFFYYARGSLYESKTWIVKASKRGLINASMQKELVGKMNLIGIKLNNYIKSIGQDQ